MKTLYFDVEHGSQTLGSKKLIAEKFGLPMLTPSSWDEFQQTIGKIYKNETIKEVIDFGNGFKVNQSTNKITCRSDFKIDNLVIDTFSELSKKFMRTLTDKSGKMKLQEWGRLKNKLDTCLEFVTRIPGNVICTCHARTQTMDSGENRLQPYIDGSTKEDVSKWFDFVFYTKTIVDGNGKRRYMWVTQNTETYNHAKDRTQLLDAEIEQDFRTVFEAAKQKGFDGCKILIIGSPGSGKTYSLTTLVPTERTPMEQAADAEDPELDEPETQTVHSSNGITEVELPAQGESEDIQKTIKNAVKNGSATEVAYLRGETNNIEEVSNANTNS